MQWDKMNKNTVVEFFLIKCEVLQVLNNNIEDIKCKNKKFLVV